MVAGRLAEPKELRGMLVEVLARLTALGELLARLEVTGRLERLAGVLASILAGLEMLVEEEKLAVRVGRKDRSINWSIRDDNLSLRCGNCAVNTSPHWLFKRLSWTVGAARAAQI